MKTAPDIQPINEVKSKVVQLQIDFPESMEVSEKVGIDGALLEKLCHYAGLARLTITTNSEEQAPQAIMVGHEDNGVAHGGFAEAKDQTRYQVDRLASKAMFRLNTWNVANIVLDREALLAEVREAPRGLRDVSAWAKVLDRRLRKELLETGFVSCGKNEYDYLALYIRFGVLLIDMCLVLAFYSSETNDTEKFSCLVVLVMTHLLLYFFTRVEDILLKEIQSGTPRPRRWSQLNVMGAELDQFAIFAYHLYFNALVYEVVDPPEERSQ